MSTAYLNNYVAPAPAVVPSLTLETAANWQDYDFNFSGGPVYELSTDKIRMIPFNPIRELEHRNQLKTESHAGGNRLLNKCLGVDGLSSC